MTTPPTPDAIDVSSLIDDVREAVSDIETGCHPLSDSKRYGHAHDDLSTALDAIEKHIATLTAQLAAANAVTDAHVQAANAFFNYGATRGNHVDGGGRGNGPLTPHVERMGELLTALDAMMAARTGAR